MGALAGRNGVEGGGDDKRPSELGGVLVVVCLAVEGGSRVEADRGELGVSRVGGAAGSRLGQPDGRVCARLGGRRDVGGPEVVVVSDGAHRGGVLRDRRPGDEEEAVLDAQVARVVDATVTVAGAGAGAGGECRALLVHGVRRVSRQHQRTGGGGCGDCCVSVVRAGLCVRV